MELSANLLAAQLASTIKGKVVLITGVSPGGLGAQFAVTISKHAPALLILAGRSEKKYQETAKECGCPTRFLSLSLASLKDVRRAASDVLRYEEPIDILVNNAGIMAHDYATTEDGIESQFAINHIAHFLLTNLLVPKLLASKTASRIVNVSSDGARLSPIRFDDLQFDNGKTYDRWRAYGQSKTANMLFTTSLAEKLGHRGVTSASLHPGVISTQLFINSGGPMEHFNVLGNMDKEQGNRQGWAPLKYLTPDQGTATHVFAAFDDSIAQHNGAFCDEAKVVPPENVRSWMRDPIEAQRLWTLSEKLVGETFDWST